ncbi:MAG TPA: FAD-dependent thymidylate synthase [Terriglobia bacterium]|nr:FAD-dependent thymidylate synthase [Terriglobia bacterium]
MPEDLSTYRPDFSPGNWSAEDLHFLKAFASNPGGIVSVLRNLPPEITGALCSRASRASGSLFEVLLKEYIYPIVRGEDAALARELKATVEFLKEHGFRNILNNQRAQAFYSKWLSQYGDDSIAQITGAHVIVWGISQVAMKCIEDQRVGLEPIEKSTRYVNFGMKVGGRYLYYIPAPDLLRHGLLDEYVRVMDHLFDTYVTLLGPLQAWLRKNFDEKESILEKKAFDTLRGLLPMATLGQVAFRGNAQSFEYLINRSAKHPLGELRWFASELKTELDTEIPSLLLRVADGKSQDYQSYLNRRYDLVRRFLGQTANLPAPRPEVRLIDADPESETKILAGIIFQQTHGAWDQAMERARSLNESGKRELFRQYLPERKGRWYKVGRAFENAYLRFEIVMDIGSYRDLHRHRMMTQERQTFSTLHGFSIPAELEQAGLASPFADALERADKLFRKIEPLDRDLAQYAVPLAYRMRFYQWQNFRQLFWEAELRTISQGHPDYRFIEQEKFRLIKERFPLIAEFMLVDMNDYAIARRGTEERIEEKEKRIVEQLKKRQV